MLIVNINNSQNEKFRGRFFKKQIRPDPFKRSCLSICDKSCTLIEFDESVLPTINISRLLNTFNGRIIGPDNVIEKLIPHEYRFDFKPYFKRALLSSLFNNLDNNRKNLSVSVKDESFIFSNEYCNLANAVKTFTLISRENDETEKFCNRCFVEYGNFIRVEEKLSIKTDVEVDFNDLDNDGKILINKEGNEQLLYPDPKYFLIKGDLLNLVNMGINPKVLCAAFDVLT